MRPNDRAAAVTPAPKFPRMVIHRLRREGDRSIRFTSPTCAAIRAGHWVILVGEAEPMYVRGVSEVGGVATLDVLRKPKGQLVLTVIPGPK